jgi:hypothetical protein
MRPSAAATASQETRRQQCDDRAGPGRCVSVATAYELGAAPLDRPFGLADIQVLSTQHGLESEGNLAAATAHCRPPGVAELDGLLESPHKPAQRGRHIQEHEPRMNDGLGGRDQLLRPRDGLAILYAEAEEPGIRRNGGGHVEVALVGGPPKRYAGWPAQR